MAALDAQPAHAHLPAFEAGFILLSTSMILVEVPKCSMSRQRLPRPPAGSLQDHEYFAEILSSCPADYTATSQNCSRRKQDT